MATTYKKLEGVTQQWGVIQEENISHRQLVTRGEWQTWETFNKKTTDELTTILNEFDENDGELSSASADRLAQIGQSFKAATHMSKRELEARDKPVKAKALSLLKNFHH